MYRVLIDVTGDKASSGLATSIQGAVAERLEGGFGKLKAGAGAPPFDSIGVLGPAAIGAAAPALVGKFILNGTVQRVRGPRPEGQRLRDGDRAARWMTSRRGGWKWPAMSCVNVGTLEGAINKMNLAAGKGDLAKLGIEGQTTSDQLLNALTHLQGIPDASQRATEGVKIFGKSWTQLAPLVESSKDLKQALQDVSEGQVIDPAEVEKAKRYRDAVDNLSDAWANFTLKVGEAAIGPISDALELVGELADQVGSLGGKAGGKGSTGAKSSGLSKLSDVTGGLKQAGDSSLSLVDNMKGIGKATFGLIPGLGGWADSTFTVTSAPGSGRAVGAGCGRRRQGPGRSGGRGDAGDHRQHQRRAGQHQQPARLRGRAVEDDEGDHRLRRRRGRRRQRSGDEHRAEPEIHRRHARRRTGRPRPSLPPR